ncbi:C-type lectin domain family 4 member D-like [Nothobranchius furzeri]|uniref:C-type lectin domain family 4 member D-like n=3 Tax=Nothobranchius furzeri TaxID=105023 RepID=A0A9D2YVB8_NOTFU|nr:C-type lectin domain family 4 member D isoform X2 [Nothobranchius furzeri]KAF7226993.1 C-type lectin domain family 4 member D-like [Nothobranchius furzeri]
MSPLKGNLGAVLCVLLGLLVPELSCQADKSPEAEAAFLKVRLALMKNHYRLLCNQFASLALNCSAPPINCTECPDGWLQVEDQCFLLSSEKLDFSSSAGKCKDVGAHLAILTTREQHEAVEKEGRRIGGFYTNYWIGLSDAESEGEWRWVDKSVLKTSFWNVHKSEPDNNTSGGPDGEDCVVVDSYTQSWYDVPCDFLYPRICQKAASPLV